jgi:hypothetical protein
MKFLVCVVLFTLALSQSIEWKACADGTLQIQSLTARPDPPKAGARFDIHLKGNLRSQIRSGKGSVVVLFEGFELFRQDNIDICNFGGALKCPVAAGPVDIKYGAVIPGVAPIGPYQIKITMADQDAKVITCIDAKFDMDTPFHAAKLK